MREFCLTAEENDVNSRLDKFISQRVTEFSRSFIVGLLEADKVSCNGKTVSKSHRLKQGDVVTFNVEEPSLSEVVPQNIPLNVVYEDNYLLVVDKPRGMVVHPGAGNSDGTLVNALLYHCKESLSGIGGVIRPGIVHRIDKDTSGLLVVAKNDEVHLALSRQLENHSMNREYMAVIHGRLKEHIGSISAPIGRHPNDRKKMAVTEKSSRHAVTHWEVLEEYREFSLVKLKLETGRTHQIRVHMAFLNRPVAGDDVYGPKKSSVPFHGQCLHAATLGFIHPITGERLEFTSELPDFFVKFIELLRRKT